MDVIESIVLTRFVVAMLAGLAVMCFVAAYACFVRSRRIMRDPDHGRD